ncbi:MAG: CHASE3 domain-containing protein [Chitinophagaceae bacterium]
MKKPSLSSMLKAGVAAAFLVAAIILYVSIQQSRRLYDTTALVRLTNQQQVHLQKLVVAALDNETGARGFVITGEKNFLEPLIRSEENFEKELTELSVLFKGNAKQEQLLDSLRSNTGKRMAYSREMVRVRTEKGMEEVVAMVRGGAGKAYTDKIRYFSNQVEAIANTMMVERMHNNDRVIRNLNILLYSVFGAVFLLSLYMMYSFKKDISRREVSERKFIALLDAAPDATVIVNEAGIISMINLQTEKLFGYSREEMIGQPVEILVPLTKRSVHTQHRDGFMKAAKVRAMGAGIELNAVKKDGSSFPVEISLSPISTDDGLLVSASVRDITDRKILENSLRKTNEELEAFSYSVSHDLRAPLRAIIGYTTILEEEYAGQLDEEARRITQVIRHNTLRMGHLIDDLLTFSRLGRQELQKIPVNTHALVQEIIEDIISKPGYRAAEWKVASLPVVMADLNTLRQVWVNLISNAVKYSSKKQQPEIQIGCKLRNGEYIFSVFDNGVGFDNKYQHKLFRVFQRLHGHDEFEGTGVGLALCERIIFRHGGRIWAEGEKDKGARFYFSLPVIQP